MNILPSLSLWQWAVLLAVVPAIISLYFLKLKREPLEVPSTYLWTRAIEDLHVNSIWQRLRQSLLLLLQLLVAALILLACLNPGWWGATLTNHRLVLLIDTSASMSATDLGVTRLEMAKKQAEDILAQMQSGDVAMLISFSDVAQIEQSFTDNRATLRRKLRQIAATKRRSDLSEALRAASGLANPGQTSQASDVNDIQVADALPATLYVFSDGGFAAVPDFSLGYLEPIYVPIGVDAPRNVGITSFVSERNPEKPDQNQVFARLENYSAEKEAVTVSLFLDDSDEIQDAARVEIAANGNVGLSFDLSDADLSGADQHFLKLVIAEQDDFSQDNFAYAAVNAPRQARVLLVTPGNDALLLALGTDEATKAASVSYADPQVLDTKSYADDAADGKYDLIIYDRCKPKILPRANTLFIAVAPSKDWTLGERQGPPLIDDTDQTHPVMHLVEMGNVLIVEGRPVRGAIDPQTGTPKSKPLGGAILIDADIGPLLTIAPREGFEDAVLGFEIIATNDKNETVVNTDWPIRLSFPLFMKNVLEYLGGHRAAQATANVQPGNSVSLRTSSPVETVDVHSPNDETTTVQRGVQNAFVFTRTEEPGIYEVREGAATKVSRQFAVNLFDSRETDLRPRETIELGYEEVTGHSVRQLGRKELWKWLIMGGLVVLLLEWYVYNRRVYL